MVEDLLPQLMPGEAELKPVDGPHTNASKRKVQVVAVAIGKRRKRSTTLARADGAKDVQTEQTKTDHCIDWESIGRTVQDKGEPTVEVSLIAMNGLVAALQSGSNQLARNEKSGERTEKALTEIAGILGKVADYSTDSRMRLKKTLKSKGEEKKDILKLRGKERKNI